MASLQAYTTPLDRRLAAHLLRRASYVVSRERIDELTGMTAAEAVDALFVMPPLTIPEPIDWITNQPWINSGVITETDADKRSRAVTGWWMNEARQDIGIGHKLMFFLHQNFVVSASENVNSREQFDYLALLRHYAFGSYRDFATKMTLDNSMLNYIDGEDNTKGSPNENYAREFLELYTIGKGPQVGLGDYTHFTEADIITAAKLLTGWKRSPRVLGPDPNYLDPDTGIQTGYAFFSHHDTSNKTFSVSAFQGQTIIGANTTQDMYRELDDFVNMVFAQEQTAKNICRKLYRYFVHTKITAEVETDIIEPLAATLRNNDYNMATTVKELLKSQHFYDKDDNDSSNNIIGGLLKSPFELLMHIMSFFKMDVIDPVLEPKEHYNEWWDKTVNGTMFIQTGFLMFEPGSVAGYPAYYQEPNLDKNWFSTSSIIARYKMPEILMSGFRIFSGGTIGKNMKLDHVLFLRDKGVISNNFDAATIVRELTHYLFPEEPIEDRFDYYLNDVFLNGIPAFDWTEDWIDYLNTNDDLAVKLPLGRLITTVLYSQDFQLM